MKNAEWITDQSLKRAPSIFYYQATFHDQVLTLYETQTSGADRESILHVIKFDPKGKTRYKIQNGNN